MRLKHFCTNALQSAYYLQALLRSRAYTASVNKLKSTPHSDELFILANGPSLKRDIEGYAQTLKKCDVLMMNYSIMLPLHEQIQPKYHIFMDSMYFVGDKYNNVSTQHYKRIEKEVQATIHALETINYPLILLVPNIWQDRLHITNPLITLRTYGIFQFKGFDFIARRLFCNALASPSYHNVLVPSLVCAIAMGYKKIYLLGCDHDWFKNYFVTNSNLFCGDYKHFYKEKDTDVEIEKDRLCDFLYYDSEILRSYHILRRVFKDISFYNCSSHSAIQAFQRISLGEILTGGGAKLKFIFYTATFLFSFFHYTSQIIFLTLFYISKFVSIIYFLFSIPKYFFYSIFSTYTALTLQESKIKKEVQCCVF